MSLALVLTPIIGSVVIATVNLRESQTKRLGLTVSLFTYWIALSCYAGFDLGLVGYQGYMAYDPLGLNLAYDGISLSFIILTGFLTPIVLLASWNNVTKHQGGFISCQLAIEGLLMLVWIVTDLVSFYVAFEAVLIPLFVTVGVWGAANRVRSAFLLFMFTLTGSLFMLISLVIIYLNVGSGAYALIMALDLDSQVWVWAGLFVAFAVKTPMVPVHMWLPRAHADAPLAASMVLAGTVLKIAAYGYLRLCLGLMPIVTQWIMPLVIAIAVVSLIYSSLATIRQADVKALIAYSSIGHMAVVILGLFSNTVIGMVGAILLSLAHGVVSPALFILTGGVLYDRFHTRVIYYYRGLSQSMPIFSALFFVFTVMNMGQPLSLNWAGEFTSLIGLFVYAPVITIMASTVQVLSAAYAIWVYVRMISGSMSPYLCTPNSLTFDLVSSNATAQRVQGDLTRREYYCLVYLLVPALVFGIYAVPLTNLMTPALAAYIVLGIGRYKSSYKNPPPPSEPP